uniref:Uncharacterized protein n=1 Tax=Phaseolus vulgaris TaxID=3885 RepID=V7CXC6_PHAVU|nr:hypothetical protein PHAVU_001G185300g [Phaseolus vulgaris]ESW34832.1 hypothetical protein PHAVU_001G185300g [Phaseolus vulgaris]
MIQHRPGRLDNSPGLDDSTSARAHSTRHRSGPVHSTKARAWTYRQWPGSERLDIPRLNRLDIDPCPSTRHRPKSEQLDIDPISSTLARAQSTRHRPGQCNLREGKRYRLSGFRGGRGSGGREVGKGNQLGHGG